MRKVMADITEMQQHFADNAAEFQQVIDGVKTGHADIVERLSNALGEIQFQDVMRQRVVCVQQALDDLNGHLQGMADQMVDQPWDPDAMGSVRERLRDHTSRYVMSSQRVTHGAVTGEAVEEEAGQPRIELF
jgi:methyl-accepting chemotaxis protein